MPPVDADTFWRLSPAPQMIVDREDVRDLNPAAEEMLGYSAEELRTAEDWQELLFVDVRHAYKFHRHVYEDHRSHADLELRSREGHPIYIRLKAAPLPVSKNGEKLYLLSLADHTELREDSLVLQAGYDEFMKVTTELEDAVATIEKQNQQLERQRSILQNELSIAHKVQSQLLTEDFARFRIVQAAGFYATMADLGGDTWEFYEDDHCFIGVIGDVMGHGVAASLIGIAAKTLCKKTILDTARGELSLAKAAARMNLELLEITRGNYYITMCVVKINRSDYSMEYLTAGHPPLFLARAEGGAAEQLYTSQPMLGIFQKQEYVSGSTQLYPRDRVLLYTDCLLETADPGGNLLRLEDIVDLVRYEADETPDRALEKILEYRRRHGASETLPDDLAIALLERPAPGTGAAQSEKSIPASAAGSARTV